MVFDFLSENLIPDPLAALLIPIPRLVIPDRTLFFASDPRSHIPRYDPDTSIGGTARFSKHENL